VESAYDQAKRRSNNAVYSPLVLMWLLIWQRLQGAAPLDAVVIDLLQTLPACFWPNPCKRVREWQQSGKPVSGNTAAYNQARQRLPLSVVEKSCDQIFERLMERLAPASNDGVQSAFVLDGSSMRLAHSPALVDRFPPSSNQHGESHWPVMRVLVAHDLQTGLAMRPQWGPMYGKKAVSEQQLLEDCIARLPSGAVVIGDSNFGVFSVAWAATQKGYPVLLRLTLERARRLLGKDPKKGMDRKVEWKPSPHERKHHPGLPPEACVHGRVFVRHVQPRKEEKPYLLVLFATLPEPAKKVVKLYGQRWNIETDLRTLKSHLCMEQLSCATPEMAAKEIEMAIAAYNLVRAVISLAAQQSGLQPRDYSFNRASRIVQSFAITIGSASSPKEAQRHWDRMMYFLKQAKLSRRKRKSYPRAVWGTGEQYPKHKK
jgi:putative transposase